MNRLHVSATLMTVAIVLFASSLAVGQEPDAPPRPIDDAPSFYLIRPGTQVVNGPPQAWSHLVAKAHSKLASGEIDTLPGWAAQTAASIRTVILADVGRSAQDPNRFVLRKVGVGLCMPNRKGKDTIVSAEKAADLGFEFGTLEKVVVESAEAELARGRLIVATSTLGVFQSPTMMVIGEEHKSVQIFYGLVVNTETGELRIAVWAREDQPSQVPSVNRLVELRPNLIYECPINVKANRLLGTIPVTWSFAMQGLLPGQSRSVSRQLSSMMDTLCTGELDPQTLEKGLKRCLTDDSTLIKITPSRGD